MVKKLFETLVNREEMVKATDLGDYFRIPADNRDLNYDQYFSEGIRDVSDFEEYTSHNTHRLDKKGMMDLLLKLPSVRHDILNEQNAMQYLD